MQQTSLCSRPGLRRRCHISRNVEGSPGTTHLLKTRGLPTKDAHLVSVILNQRRFCFLLSPGHQIQIHHLMLRDNHVSLNLARPTCPPRL